MRFDTLPIRHEKDLARVVGQDLTARLLTYNSAGPDTRNTKHFVSVAYCACPKCEGRVFGAHVFALTRAGHLTSLVTFVHPDAQQFGYGADLWFQSLAFVDPRRVTVTCCSKAGARLIENVRVMRPWYDWRVWLTYDGDRRRAEP